MTPFTEHLAQQLAEVRKAGLYKGERPITTPQEAHVAVLGKPGVLNMCANNYLGLADHPDVVAAAHKALDQWGYGLASVRFICGTQAVHKELERAISSFLGTEDTILYSSCFDANGGLFETLLGEQDAVISDELNHASIIDGVRLCKAMRYRYKNNDPADLEAKLMEANAAGARYKLVATDGVFSMDGTIANLPALRATADKHNAMLMIDDSHAVGFMGKTGRGSHEHHALLGKIDIITGTLGKALGGASGGYTSGKKEVVEWLRQRSRPYLFSNSLPPVITATSLKVLELLQASPKWRDTLMANTKRFRAGMTQRGFNILPGEHPIVPVMLGDAALASRFADAMFQRGVYVVGFSFPVVPQGKARIRVQLSAAHSTADVDFALEAFAAVKAELRV